MKDWENLIDTVRTFPVLYDPRHKDYMKTNLKDRVWDHISKKLNIRDGEMAKTQWIKLRNCYRVSLWRQMKKRSDHSDAFIRPWLYQKNMEFLLPFMRNYRSLGELIDFNGSHEEDDHTYGEANNDIIDYETIVNEFEASKKQGNSSNELETFHYVDNVECELREISPKKVSPKKKPPMINNTSEENMILKTLKRLEEKSVARNIPNSFTNINQPSSEDPLFSFFLSMYDTTKNLPVRQQLEVRRQVFSLITKVEENILINESGSSNYSGVVVVGTRNNESSTYLSDSSQWRQ